MSEIHKLKIGDWVVHRLGQRQNWCYEIRGIQGSWQGGIWLRAFNIESKVRFNCSDGIDNLILIRTKEGARVDPPLVLSRDNL